MAKILIVEDEPHMRMGLRDNLEFESYEVEMAENGRKALEMLDNQTYDLILLDVMMPEISGFDVCKQARKKGITSPIIFLTAKGEEIDKVLGLELGADDYIVKPFSLRELLARVKAVLRRTGSSDTSQSKITVGNLTFDFQHYEAFQGDTPIKLSHKEFEIVHHLWDHKNEIVSREQLLKQVWGYEAQPTTRTVDNFILKLRQKIEANPNEPKFILTVHGIGYKLVI
ncbi:MAG: response regulator transcription factor [bacterium]|jgi:DNA-binding response OmpR family regulator|nr:response regulator transcription factor [bacterium]